MSKYICVFLCVISLSVFAQDTVSVYLDARQAATETTNLAIEQFEKGNGKESFRYLKEAIESDSMYRPPYVQLYKTVTLYSECIDSALNLLNKGKRIFPKDDELHFFTGELFRFKSDYKNAIIEYSAAIEYSAEYEASYLLPFYYFNRGNSYLKLKQYKTAIKDYDNLLILNPEYYPGLTNRGFCLYQIGQKQEACENWKRAVKAGYQKAQTYLDKLCK